MIDQLHDALLRDQINSWQARALKAEEALERIRERIGDSASGLREDIADIIHKATDIRPKAGPAALSQDKEPT